MPKGLRVNRGHASMSKFGGIVCESSTPMETSWEFSRQKKPCVKQWLGTWIWSKFHHRRNRRFVVSWTTASTGMSRARREKEPRRNQKTVTVKELRMRPKIDDHDFEVKARNARRFLKDGDKVKISVASADAKLSIRIWRGKNWVPWRSNLKKWLSLSESLSWKGAR